jgi:hypothetical protein
MIPNTESDPIMFSKILQIILVQLSDGDRVGFWENKKTADGHDASQLFLYLTG